MKLFGPLQLYVMLPVEALDAKSCNRLPLQIGAFVVANGVAGGVGSESVIVVASGVELQPFKVTNMFVYTPALNAVIVTSPDAFAIRLLTTVGAPPFLT